MVVTDESAALEAVTTLHELSEGQQVSKIKIDEILSSDTPIVDIHELLALYNVLYFRDLLLPRVEASWSSRLTLCAGICELVKDEHGKYRRIRLKLSEPLLKFRPRSDVINTLLHEAIHAYLFITSSWRHSRGDDGTGHGAGFLLLADAINHHGGYEITVYHTFHDEVDSYRTHMWLCDGPCRQRPPYFGLVQRSMNRPPGKGDSWWARHQAECGGTYSKIAEPEMSKAKLRSMTAKARAGQQKNKIDQYVQTQRLHDPQNQGGPPSDTKPESVEKGVKRRAESGGNADASRIKRAPLACPVCGVPVTEEDINPHLDEAHN